MYQFPVSSIIISKLTSSATSLKTFFVSMNIFSCSTLSISVTWVAWLTLFLLGGPFGPEWPKTVWHFHNFMTRVTKIPHFVWSVSVWSHWSVFWKKKYEISKNWKTKIYRSDIKGSPFGKKSKKFQKIVFFQKFLFFELVSEFYMFLAFFWAI